MGGSGFVGGGTDGRSGGSGGRIEEGRVGEVDRWMMISDSGFRHRMGWY